MFARIRLSRLITAALATCAVTWAFAAGAFARPDTSTSAAAAAPAYQAVAGDTDKAPAATRPPAFKGIVVDANKSPDAAAVDRNLASIGHGKTPGVTVSGGDDNTGTIALITAIAAMLVALGAVTMTVVRGHSPVLRA